MLAKVHRDIFLSPFSLEASEPLCEFSNGELGDDWTTPGPPPPSRWRDPTSRGLQTITNPPSNLTLSPYHKGFKLFFKRGVGMATKSYLNSLRLVVPKKKGIDWQDVTKQQNI